MKWIYFYTADYLFWHKHLNKNLSNTFVLEPIIIGEINTSSNKGKHHFHGVSIKIDLLIEKIKENMGKIIVFSDCTLWINEENIQELSRYLESFSGKYDLVLPDNTIDRTANIGLLLINCTPNTLHFFLKAKKKLSTYPWDQEAVNRCLPGSWILRITKFRKFHKLLPPYRKLLSMISGRFITWSMFDKLKIVCGTELPADVKKSFFVYKQFINSSSPNSNWNQRISKLYENGLIDELSRNENLRN